jgi:hypothetical protein
MNLYCTLAGLYYIWFLKKIDAKEERNLATHGFLINVATKSDAK